MNFLSPAKTSQGRIVPPTSGLEHDALLFKRLAGPDAWNARFDEFQAIRRLEDDWDGLGAPAPSTALVDSALQFALLMRQTGTETPCRVGAGLTGTIIFEWQGGGGYAEVEVTDPGRAEFVRIMPGYPSTQDVLVW